MIHSKNVLNYYLPWSSDDEEKRFLRSTYHHPLSVSMITICSRTQRLNPWNKRWRNKVMSARWRNSFDNRNKRCCGTCDSDLDNSDRDNSGGRATVADIPDSRAVGQGKRDNWSGPVGRDTWDNSTVRASAFCCALDTVGILNPVGDSLDWGKDKADTRCWSQQDTMDTHRSWNAPCRS